MNQIARLVAAVVLLAELVAPFAPAFAAGANLVSNPSAETAVAGTPTGWLQGHWGTNTPAFSYTSTGAEDGTHALSLTVTGYIDGDAKWYFAPVPVIGGAQYSFSDYFQSTVASSVIVQTDDGAGNYSYTEPINFAASSVWKPASATFIAPSGAKTATVFHVIAANGTLATDNFSLSVAAVPTPSPVPTPTPAPTPVPFATGVPNPSAETVAGAQPAGWTGSRWGSNVATFSYLNTGHTGTRSLSLTVTHYASGTANWAYAPQPVSAGTRYVFNDWYKSTVASEVDIAVTMADSSTQYLYVGSAPVASTWTRERAEFVMPAGAVKANLMHLMYQDGSLTTDDYSFLPYAPVGFNRALVTLTFDDGWSTQYTSALPVMKKYGFIGTYFIVSGFLTVQPDYMTVAQIASLKAAGNQIGSHSVTHPDLTTLSAAALTNEFKISQTALAAKFGGPIQDFASPYGTYSNTTVAAAAKYYRSQRSTDSGYNSKDDLDVYRLRVQNMTNITTPAQVQAWVAQAAHDKTWLILVFHQLSPVLSTGDYDTTPANLDTEMSNLKTSGVPVVTMSQAITELTAQLVP